jgi:hypothetical protein
MTTGPEHYLAAEQLLDAADAYEADGAPQTAAARRTEAQVHATLAQAAATALLAELFATRADINHVHVDGWDDATTSTAQDDDSDWPSASELHEMDQHDEAALDAAEAEFATDTEGQR